MSKIKINPDRLNEAIKLLDKSYNEISAGDNSVIKDLNSLNKELTDDWSGSAQMMFTTRMSLEILNVSKMKNYLLDLKDCCNELLEIYKSHDMWKISDWGDDIKARKVTKEEGKMSPF